MEPPSGNLYLLQEDPLSLRSYLMPAQGSHRVGWKSQGRHSSQPCSGEISSKNLASDMGFMADFLNKGSFPPGIMESEEANPRLQDKMGGRWREHAKVNPKPSDIIN